MVGYPCFSSVRCLLWHHVSRSSSSSSEIPSPQFVAVRPWWRQYACCRYHAPCSPETPRLETPITPQYLLAHLRSGCANLGHHNTSGMSGIVLYPQAPLLWIWTPKKYNPVPRCQAPLYSRRMIMTFASNPTGGGDGCRAAARLRVQAHPLGLLRQARGSLLGGRRRRESLDQRGPRCRADYFSVVAGNDNQAKKVKEKHDATHIDCCM